MEKIFMLNLIDDFKAFVSVACNEGMHKNHEDHLEFMQVCLDLFVEMKIEENK